MNRIFLLPLFLSFFAVNCKNASSDKINTGLKDSTVVFFNIKQYSRKELGYYIDKISAFKPKVIALNVQFNSLSDPSEDSVLAVSIAKAGNVILSASIDNNILSMNRSHPIFTNAAKGQGVISYLVSDDNTTTEFIPLFENDVRQEISFPNQIVYNYTDGKKGFKNLRVNRHESIHYYYKNENDFFLLDEANMSSELISGKIVIFGYLGPGEENPYWIPLGDGRKLKSYCPVVTANIVLNLLSDPY